MVIFTVMPPKKKTRHTYDAYTKLNIIHHCCPYFRLQDDWLWDVCWLLLLSVFFEHCQNKGITLTLCTLQVGTRFSEFPDCRYLRFKKKP